MSKLEEFKKALRASLKRNREAFEGEYADEINGLLALSKKQIDAITPDATDLAVYDQLVTVVKEASRANLTQAQLKAEIVKLGSTALEVAKMVKPLAALVA